MSGLRFHPIELNKDSYENVAGIVYKNMHAVASNLVLIKRWAEKDEDRSKSAEAQCQQLDGRVQEIDAALHGMQDQLGEVSEQLREALGQQRAQADTFAMGTWQMLSAVNVLFSLLGRSFNVDDLAQVHDAPAPVASLGSECPGDAPDEQGPAEEGEQSSVSLESLRALGSAVEAQRGSLKAAFDNWDEWRGLLERQRLETLGRIEGLATASGELREESVRKDVVLGQHSDAIGALSAALRAAEGAVGELQATQVRREDVEEMVGARAEQLVLMLGETDDHVQEVSNEVEAHVQEMQRDATELQRQIEERIEQHSSHISKTMERTLAPINLYLNTMHVKVDETRSASAGLARQISELQASIKGVSSELTRSEGQGQERAGELGSQVEELQRRVAECMDRGEAQNASLSDSVSALSRQLGEEVTSVGDSLSAVAQAVEALKQGQVSNLASNLSALEQKVAKWVRSHPLPAKVGEARLYSLETRLKEETNARLQLEMTMMTLQEGEAGERPPSQTIPFKPTISLPENKLALPHLQSMPAGGEPLGSARNSSSRKAKRELSQRNVSA